MTRETTMATGRRRRTMARAVRLAALVAGAVALLGGCAARSAPLEVALREAGTRRPAAGYEVRVAGADVMDPRTNRAVDPALAAGAELATGGAGKAATAFPGGSALTDVFGLGVVDAPLVAPFEIAVLRRGEPVRRLMLGGAEHPARRGIAGPWVTLDGPLTATETDGPVLELQVRPTPY